MIRENLRKVIDEKGFTIKVLAEKSGVAKRTIDKWVGSNPVEPRVTDFIKICQALEVSAESVVLGRSDPKDLESQNLLVLARKHHRLLVDFDALDEKEQSIYTSVIAEAATRHRMEQKKRQA